MRLSIVTRPRPDKSGEVPLYVRVQHSNKTVYVGLGLRIHPKQWNARRSEARTSYPDADDFNRGLRQKLATATAAANRCLLREGRNASADKIKEEVAEAINPDTREGGADFITYARDALRDGYHGRGKVASGYAYGSGISKLEARYGRLPFDKITTGLLRSFYEWLVSPKPQGEGLALNTAAKYIGGIATLLRRAADDGVAGAAQAAEAAVKIKTPKERGSRDRLTIEQIEHMRSADLEGRKADVRDWFVFAFYAGGMRFSDVATLRWDDVVIENGKPTRIRWTQTKTAGAVGVPALPAAVEILERWKGRDPVFVFGLVTEDVVADAKRLRATVGRRSALARKYLYKMADAWEWPRFGTHAARHSFADHMRKSGADLYAISKALGHSSLAVTERYWAGFDELHVESEMRRVFSETPSTHPDRT